ncbi:MAG TPA: hypothetical protein VEC76_04240 [Streptosporangiaceae bacterium]|nr:hypothetical protein [Streptosporangiaceae bacterium]
MTGPRPPRVGLAGAGLVAQVMHLHHLTGPDGLRGTVPGQATIGSHRREGPPGHPAGPEREAAA